MNKLDSSAPSVRRGKEREKPRKKRKTKVKKIILEERARRREERRRKLEEEEQSKKEEKDGQAEAARQDEVEALVVEVAKSVNVDENGKKEATEIVMEESEADPWLAKAKQAIHSKKFRE